MVFGARLTLGVLLSAVALAPALAQEAMAEPQNAAVGGIAIGATGLLLPSFSAPPISGTGSAALINDTFNILAGGGTVTLGGSVAIGSVGSFQGGINLNAFGTFAKGSASNSRTLSGDGTLYIPGITTPAGTITLTTDAGTPSAASDIAGTTSDQTVTVPANAGGAQNAWGAQQGIPGEFTLAGGGTYNGAPANFGVAFGAIANESGGAFLASGDLTGVVVTTTTSVDIMYTGVDLTYGLSGALSSGMFGQFYAGPSLRYLGQHFTTDISVNMAEVQPVAPANYEFPIYTQTTRENLDTSYAGGVIGASISTQINEEWSMSLNGEGGLYWARANLSASESYTLSGGGNVPLTTQTVDNATGWTDTQSKLAYAARVQAVFSKPISRSQQIHFGGNLEYLSAAPTITRTAAANPVTEPGAGDATYSGASTGGTPAIGWGSMINFGASASLTGQF